MKWLIFVSLLFCFWMVQAHQPDISSTMLLEKEDGNWILQVRAALTAFDYEILAHYGKDSYATPEEFQELVISHLKENITISFNGRDNVVLQNAYVKLGHETNVVFEVLGVPSTLNNISVKNSSFKEINRNQSALIILKKGVSKEQFILNEANNHTAYLKLVKSKFVLVTDSSSRLGSWSPYWMIPLFIIGALFVFMWFKKKQGKS